MAKVASRVADYISEAHRRAQRRRSLWNLLLLPLALGSIGLAYTLLFRLVWRFHLHFYPADELRELLQQPINLASFLISFALVPGAVGLGLMFANAMAWCVSPARRVFEKEAENHPGTTFTEAMSGLFRLTLWTLPIGVVLALVAAYLWPTP